MEESKLRSPTFSTPNSSKLAAILLQLKEISGGADVNISPYDTAALFSSARGEEVLLLICLSRFINDQLFFTACL